MRDKWLVGVVARQDVRISGYEVGEEGRALLWQTSVATPGVRLHLAHSGSTRKISVGECVPKGHCGFKVKGEPQQASKGAEETMAGVRVVIAISMCVCSLPFPASSSDWPGFGLSGSEGCGERGKA